jgi:hypothetical protein
VSFQGTNTIKVKGCPHLLYDIPYGDLLTPQLIFSILEIIHLSNTPCMDYFFNRNL